MSNFEVKFPPTNVLHELLQVTAERKENLNKISTVDSTLVKERSGLTSVNVEEWNLLKKWLKIEDFFPTFFNEENGSDFTLTFVTPSSEHNGPLKYYLHKFVISIHHLCPSIWDLQKSSLTLDSSTEGTVDRRCIDIFLRLLYNCPLDEMPPCDDILFQLYSMAQRHQFSHLISFCARKVRSLSRVQQLKLIKDFDEYLRKTKNLRFIYDDPFKNALLLEFSKTRKIVNSVEENQHFQSLSYDVKTELLTLKENNYSEKTIDKVLSPEFLNDLAIQDMRYPYHREGQETFSETVFPNCQLFASDGKTVFPSHTNLLSLLPEDLSHSIATSKANSDIMKNVDRSRKSLTLHWDADDKDDNVDAVDGENGSGTITFHTDIEGKCLAQLITLMYRPWLFEQVQENLSNNKRLIPQELSKLLKLDKPYQQDAQQKTDEKKGPLLTSKFKFNPENIEWIYLGCWTYQGFDLVEPQSSSSSSNKRNNSNNNKTIEEKKKLCLKLNGVAIVDGKIKSSLGAGWEFHANSTKCGTWVTADDIGRHWEFLKGWFNVDIPSYDATNVGFDTDITDIKSIQKSAINSFGSQMFCVNEEGKIFILYGCPFHKTSSNAHGMYVLCDK